MKGIIAALALLLGGGPAIPTQTAQNYGLPELHKIIRVTLAPSYSCRSDKDFQKGYQQTAFFVSAYSKPDPEPRSASSRIRLGCKRAITDPNRADMRKPKRERDDLRIPLSPVKLYCRSPR